MTKATELDVLAIVRDRMQARLGDQVSPAYFSAFWKRHQAALYATATDALLARPSSAHSSLFRGVDLFAGAGGFTLGAMQAGCHVALGIEKDEDAVRTARRHGHVVAKANVGDSSIYDDVLFRVDVLFGGPPCQPFSEMGAGQGQYDERDGFPLALDAIERLEPRRVVLENVRGFLSKRHAAYRARVLTDLRQHYAHVGVWKLNAKDFGVAQDRVRVFVWAAERHLDPPRPTHGPQAGHAYVGVIDVLPELEAPAVHQRSVTAKSRSTREPSPTVTTKGTLYTSRVPGIVFEKGMRERIPVDAEPADIPPRRIRADEQALIQGFPGAYTFSGTLTAQYRQVGNAVPPPLGRAVAKAIMAGLVKERLAPEQVAQRLRVENPNALLFEPRDVYDAALIGVTNAPEDAFGTRTGQLVAVYSRDTLLDLDIHAILEDEREMDPDDAFIMAADHVDNGMVFSSNSPHGPYVIRLDDPIAWSETWGDPDPPQPEEIYGETDRDAERGENTRRARDRYPVAGPRLWRNTGADGKTSMCSWCGVAEGYDGSRDATYHDIPSSQLVAPRYCPACPVLPTEAA